MFFVYLRSLTLFQLSVGYVFYFALIKSPYVLRVSEYSEDSFIGLDDFFS